MNYGLRVRREDNGAFLLDTHERFGRYVGHHVVTGALRHTFEHPELAPYGQLFCWFGSSEISDGYSNITVSVSGTSIYVDTPRSLVIYYGVR